MAFTLLAPIVPLFILGISYSVYATAMWPAVAYVVDEDSLGTAYGITTAIQNIGLTAFPLIVGAIHDSANSYKPVEVLYSSLAIAGIFFGFLLNIRDKKTGNALNAIENPRTSVTTLMEVKPADSAPLLSNSGEDRNNILNDV